jgi:hypothetical protein
VRHSTLRLSEHGGLARLVAAPAPTLCEIPAEYPDVDAALTQQLAVGLHALVRSRVHDLLPAAVRRIHRRRRRLSRRRRRARSATADDAILDAANSEDCCRDDPDIDQR